MTNGFVWTKWNGGEIFDFVLSISFHRGSPHSHITWGMNNMPAGGCSSQTQSHPLDTNNNIHINCFLL
jgi:hypothetical protein